MSGSSGSGHFAGLWLAVPLFIALVVWLRRPSTAARFGSDRRAIAGIAVVAITALALFGNGSHHSSLRTALIQAGNLPAGVTQPHVDAALATALSDEFIRYDAALEEATPARGSDIARGFKATVVGAADLGRLGIQASPPLPPEQRAVLITYEEDANPVGVLLGLGKAQRDARWALVQRIANDYLVELVTLEMLRAASSEAAQLALLASLAPTVPQAAEWISRDLKRFATGSLSPAVAAEVTRKLAHVQMYIDDPKMRALPASRKVTLP